MRLRIVVFVKQVPDTQCVGAKAMKADGTINRAALPAVFNPEDLNALEMGLALKDCYGATVVVATMGPGTAAEVLRDALCRGADEAVLLTDKAFAGADTLATSFALSRCARRIGDFDIILCGRQAIDGDTAQVGPQIAEKLHIPQIAYAKRVVQIADGKIRAERMIDGGYEILESPMPCLLTVVAGDSSTEPRPQTAKRIMKFKKAKTKSEIQKAVEQGNPGNAASVSGLVAEYERRNLLIQEWSAADAVPADEWNRLGFSGSPTKVKQVENVVLTTGRHERIPATGEGVQALIHQLVSNHTVG